MAEKCIENTAQKRLSGLFDDGSYVELDSCGDARIGYGSVQGATVFAYAEGEGGAFDEACAGKLSKVYDLAEKTGSPVVCIFDSKGVKLEAGAGILDSCSVLLGRCARISGVVPQIAAVAGTCGGFSALCASMADICVMSEDAELFLTAPFLSKAEKNGSADFALKSGAASVVCPAGSLLEKVRTLVGMLPMNNLDVSPVWDVIEPEFNAEDAVASVADAESVIELYGCEGNAHTYLGCIGGKTAGIAKVCGEVGAADSAKLARLCSLCDCFSLPLITLVDSEGFAKCAANDAAGGIKNAAVLASVYASSTAPRIAVVTGKAIGSIYSVLCGKGAGNDLTLAWPGAVIAPLAPEAMAAVLYDEKINSAADAEAVAGDYAACSADPASAGFIGTVDRIVEPCNTRQALLSAIDMLSSKRVATLPKKHTNLPY